METDPEDSTSTPNDSRHDSTQLNQNNQTETTFTSSSSAVEFEPPLASIKRLLKQSLPSNAIISKDALSALTRACGIFIIYVTACANDCARESKRSTISANDILAAIKEVDFDEFTPALQTFLENVRETNKAKKDSKKSVLESRSTSNKQDCEGISSDLKDDVIDDDEVDDDAHSNMGDDGLEVTDQLDNGDESDNDSNRGLKRPKLGD